ncbi:hypothetical protein Closa_2219 [[Clostridium] saccharolyticum WM1]|uniref:Uncharacterized protein n=1 Tax=Lacrimispora saccharolytica (strain ATCC 35040 / DSM 2544 / NRCC 2533 / WM1) TaxID=610130 RepID=D9R2E7_LACSW|nr:hypothetical protein Closa_2219 [[Clostridium] saccharolyticum WM1]
MTELTIIVRETASFRPVKIPLQYTDQGREYG